MRIARAVIAPEVPVRVKGLRRSLGQLFWITSQSCRHGGAPYVAITRGLCLHHGVFNFQDSAKGFVENVPSPIAVFRAVLHPVFDLRKKFFDFFRCCTDALGNILMADKLAAVQSANKSYADEIVKAQKVMPTFGLTSDTDWDETVSIFDHMRQVKRAIGSGNMDIELLCCN